ncbi:hypothetical protein MetexDRAFT_4122 [Methylorubrum extorquens DSM 13060]|jgi:hypothetical protein|uniref:Uncharacterized protein n=1 Tax=Methylorubrum extorquens DSM 13060 TaxID=882800 RepID=H1KNA9_METEX|nr:hypothetical protein MetexDRAFT_4122 [Methylorubrum extorquens DSM 13060]
MRFTILAGLWASACLATYSLSSGPGAPTHGVASLVWDLAEARGGLPDGCAELLGNVATAQIRRNGAFEQPSRSLHARRAGERLQAYLDADCPLGPALAVRAAAHDEAASWRASVGLPPLALDPFPVRAHP